MRTFKLYFYGLLVLIFAIFILQNYSTLTYSPSVLRLNLGFVSLESVPLPFFLIAPLFFFSRAFPGYDYRVGERRRLSKELKQLKSAQQEPKPEPRPDPKPELKPGIQPEYLPEPSRNRARKQSRSPAPRINLTREPLFPQAPSSKKGRPRRNPNLPFFPNLLFIYDQNHPHAGTISGDQGTNTRILSFSISWGIFLKCFMKTLYWPPGS